jgi:hypothetical protein
MINTPITVAITILPSQFDEALRIPRSMGPTCRFQEGTGSRRQRIPQKGVTELIKHHKVAAAQSQPQWPRRNGAVHALSQQNRDLEVVAGLC